VHSLNSEETHSSAEQGRNLDNKYVFLLLMSFFYSAEILIYLALSCFTFFLLTQFCSFFFSIDLLIFFSPYFSLHCPISSTQTTNQVVYYTNFTHYSHPSFTYAIPIIIPRGLLLRSPHTSYLFSLLYPHHFHYLSINLQANSCYFPNTCCLWIILSKVLYIM
jgi:hypothetical protein